MDLNHRWGNKSVRAVVTYSPNPFLRCDLQSKSDHTAVDLLPDLSPARIVMRTATLFSRRKLLPELQQGLHFETPHVRGI